MGLEGDYRETCFQEENSFAGTDDQRAADFQAMLDDPEIRAIICARGGYGTVRIIRQLNFDEIPSTSEVDRRLQ